MKDNQTTRRKFVRSVTVAGIAGGASVETVGAHHQPAQTGVLADGLDAEPHRRAFLRGYASASTAGLSSPPPVETLASEARAELNDHADEWMSYGEWLVDEYDVAPMESASLRVDLVVTRRRWLTRDERTSTAIVAEYDDDTGTFDTLEWTDDDPDDPDYHLELLDVAAERAADELREFRSRYVDAGSHALPDDEYLNRVAGRYWTSLRFGSDSEHILEILMGEFRG